MRIKLNTVLGIKPWLDSQLEKSVNLTYETILPGGMSIASFRIPWESGLDSKKLLGLKCDIYDNISNVWCGKIYDVSDVSENNNKYLDIGLSGPWQACAKTMFTQTYPSTISMTSNNIIAIAVANVADLLMDDSLWDSSALNLTSMSWSESNVQNVILECLRFGNNSLTPWTFLIYPQKSLSLYLSDSYVIFSSDGTNVDLFSAFGGTKPVTTSAPSFRNSYSIICNAAAGAASYATHAIAAKAYVSVEGWFYLPSGPAAEHDFITLSNSGHTTVVRLSVDSAGALYARNNVISTSYASGIIFGTNSWHHLCLYCKQSSISGEVEVYFDGIKVIDLAGLDTGANIFYFCDIGLVRTATPAQQLVFSNIVTRAFGSGEFAFVSPLNTRLITETLPYGRIQKITGNAEFMVNLSNISNSYTQSYSLQNVYNIVDVTYSSGSWAGLSGSSLSARKYGQNSKTESANVTSSSQAGLQLRNRYLEQYAEPVPSLLSFTLFKEPASCNGKAHPLSQIRAGMRFSIKELPNLGVMTVGQTRYTRGERDQVESCQITPTGPTLSIDMILAGKTAKEWS